MAHCIYSCDSLPHLKVSPGREKPAMRTSLAGSITSQTSTLCKHVLDSAPPPPPMANSSVPPIFLCFIILYFACMFLCPFLALSDLAWGWPPRLTAFVLDEYGRGPMSGEQVGASKASHKHPCFAGFLKAGTCSPAELLCGGNGILSDLGICVFY